jgi:hypothetical protein
MKKILTVPVFMIVWTGITLFALLWGIQHNLPDFVHRDYGLPMTWGTNTLSTIAGPANSWSVNIQNLFFDLVIWSGIMTATVAFIVYKFKS